MVDVDVGQLSAASDAEHPASDLQADAIAECSASRPVNHSWTDHDERQPMVLMSLPGHLFLDDLGIGVRVALMRSRIDGTGLVQRAVTAQARGSVHTERTDQNESSDRLFEAGIDQAPRGDDGVQEHDCSAACQSCRHVIDEVDAIHCRAAIRGIHQVAPHDFNLRPVFVADTRPEVIRAAGVAEEAANLESFVGQFPDESTTKESAAPVIRMFMSDLPSRRLRNPATSLERAKARPSPLGHALRRRSRP